MTNNDLVDKFCAKFGFEVTPLGKNKMRSRCPFHVESIPSFTLYLDTDTYFCFGCRRFGYISDLVGTEPDLRLRLNRATAAKEDHVELGFALACSHFRDKSVVWDLMMSFDDAGSMEEKKKILSKILQKSLDLSSSG